MIAPARTAALAGLLAVESGKIDLPTAVAQSRQHLRDERDRALAADIMAGTLRWRAALDYLIAHAARRPVARLDVEVLTILRLSLYQILHLTRVPASAVVDDAVDLVRAARKPSASGFANAVLRSLLRQRNALPLPTRPDDPDDVEAMVTYLSVTHSHPVWLVERWLSRHGVDATERWTRFNNTTPLMTLRANRLRTSREALATMLLERDIETMPTPFAPDGLVVTTGNPYRTERDGSFIVQEEASQLVPLVVGARPGERILDLCASPGGKTTELAAEMDDHGTIVATDVRPRRVRLLRDTVMTSGSSAIRVVQVPRTGQLPFSPAFDRVLVDAPCSGLGTVRRDPDIKWRRTASDLPALAASQIEILDRAAGVVRDGGRLVYATCSSEPEENDQVIAAFLASHPEFSLVDLHAEGTPAIAPFVDEYGFLRTLPFAHGLEAFFAAALVKRGRP